MCRALAGVGSDEYQECLSRALREAEAVLVLNPLAQAMLAPYCRDVRVITGNFRKLAVDIVTYPNRQVDVNDNEGYCQDNDQPKPPTLFYRCHSL